MSVLKLLLLFFLEKKSENADFLYEDAILPSMTLGRADKQVWFLRSQPSESDWTMFLKTNVVCFFQNKNHYGAQIISLSLSHQPMLCTTLFYLYARSQCLFQMHLSVGQQYQWQEGMAASTMTQTHWFQQSSHKPVLSTACSLYQSIFSLWLCKARTPLACTAKLKYLQQQ